MNLTSTNSVNCGFNPSLPGFNFEFVPTPLAAGGVGMYINDVLNYKIKDRWANEAFQPLWIKIIQPKNSNIICGVIYRSTIHRSVFKLTLKKLLKN